MQGVIGIRLTGRKGEVVAAFMVGLDDEIVAVSSGGVTIRMPVREISSQERERHRRAVDEPRRRPDGRLGGADPLQRGLTLGPRASSVASTHPLVAMPPAAASSAREVGPCMHGFGTNVARAPWSRWVASVMVVLATLVVTKVMLAATEQSRAQHAADAAALAGVSGGMAAAVSTAAAMR